MANDRATGLKIKPTIPLMANPGTNSATNHRQKPLTTSENNPKLNKLIGTESNDSVGRIVELIPPIATAAMSAAGKLAIFTPGTTKSIINKPSAVASVVIANPMRWLVLSFIIFKFETNWDD